MDNKEVISKLLQDIGNINEYDLDFDGLNIDFNNIEDAEKRLRILVYIQQRKIQKLPKWKAYLTAFNNKLEDRVKENKNHLSALANSLENTKRYKELAFILHANIFTSFIFDRYRVLNEVKEVALSQDVATRDKIEASKVFLQETRLPDDFNKDKLDDNDIKIIKAIKENLTQKAKELNNSKNFLEHINKKDNIVDAEVITK